MRDPVCDPEGNSFEREAIERWLSTRRTSPITRSSLTADKLTTNRALRDAIEEWKTMTAVPAPESALASHESDGQEGAESAPTAGSEAEGEGPESAGSGGAQELNVGQEHSDSALAKEEAEIRAKLMAVESKMAELIQHPLGMDNMGQRQVYRIKPSDAIWMDIVGDRSASSLVASGAGAAMEGAVWVVGSVVDRVVSWTYKPTLYSVRGSP